MSNVGEGAVHCRNMLLSATYVKMPGRMSLYPITCSEGYCKDSSGSKRSQ